MGSIEEIIEEKVARGLRFLHGEEAHDHTKYRLGGRAAEAEFIEALRLDPNSYRALLALGTCYRYRPTKHREAIEVLLRAIEICPERIDAHHELGLTFLHAGESRSIVGSPNPYEEALRYFEKVLAMGYEPKASIYNLLGTTCFRLGRYEDAIEWFEKSAESVGKDGGWEPSTFFLAAEASEMLGRSAEAIRWYELYKQRGLGTDHEEIDMRIRNLRILEENRKKAL